MIPVACKPARRVLCAVAVCLAGILVAAPAASAASSWFESNSPTGAGATTSFGFGEPGDIFIAGDWNGDGIDTPGVFRPRAGTEALWILSDSPTGAAPLTVFGFGITGDLPIAGDWDQDGKDTAGVMRPMAGGPNTFFLAAANVNGGGASTNFTLGNPGDTPIAGDWDGDRRDTVGIHRDVGTEAGLGDFFEADSNATTAGFGQMSFGAPGLRPLTGDWNGDGTDTVGVFAGVGSTGHWEEKVNNIRADPTFTAFEFGQGSDTPVVGDWDGNGSSTPAVIHPNEAYVAPPPSANPAVAVPNGLNASRSATLTSAFKGRKAKSLRLGFTSKPTITGRLVDEHGSAIGGATLAVQARRRQFRAATAQIDTVTTGADGAFSYTLPSGPARTITFAYTAFTGDATPAAKSAGLRTLVAASLTASISPRSPRTGQRLHVSGKLRYLPRANVQVVIQARDGKVFRTVGTVKTSAGGRYSWPYRFKRTAHGRTFAFRAHVDSPVYPFTPGNSRGFSVRVR